MTPNQYAAFFMALPFLALTCAWIVGLSFLIPRQQPARVKRNRRPQ
jgi:Na+-transporting NADH:ubiquinone oxidoreductase subunit NqrE